MKRILISILFSLNLFLPFGKLHAQEESTIGPIYIVQQGDTLWSIAQRFKTSPDEIAIINGIADPNQIAVGTQLVIPGLDGFIGILKTRTIQFGENYQSLSRYRQLGMDLLARINHHTSPLELFVGSTFVILEPDVAGEIQPKGRAALKTGESLFEMAIRMNVNPWELLMSNNLKGSWDAIPGEPFILTGVDDDNGPKALPPQISTINIEPIDWFQGRTIEMKINTQVDMTIEGSLGKRTLYTYQDSQGQYVTLQGIHAMEEPGFYALTISGEIIDGTPFALIQNIFIKDGDYPYDPPMIVDPETINPQVSEPEENKWNELTKPATTERYWTGIFESPMPNHLSACWTSFFGNRRSFNGSPYSYFHSGLDFCTGGSSYVEIYAPAAGVVVFADKLTVRGNATVINHGWGVYSAYAHQSEILVAAGDFVQTGQVIGVVGSTGRVTGPHLHWEVWVGNVQVDPMEWLEREFPSP